MTNNNRKQIQTDIVAAFVDVENELSYLSAWLENSKRKVSGITEGDRERMCDYGAARRNFLKILEDGLNALEHKHDEPLKILNDIEREREHIKENFWVTVDGKDKVAKAKHVDWVKVTFIDETVCYYPIENFKEKFKLLTEETGASEEIPF